MVRHLQTMLGYQQLSADTYNDALAAVAGKLPRGAGVTSQPQVELADALLVSQYVIPAIERKIAIVNCMAREHRKMGGSSNPAIWKPYEAMTSAIAAILRRAECQYEGFRQWIEAPQYGVDTVRLDNEERAAIDRAIKALNKLAMKDVGVGYDGFLDIVQEATNKVRGSLELKPLDHDTFRTLYMQGLTGKRVHFYRS